MALKYRVEKLEDVAESVRSFYAEKDGVFVLDVEDVKHVDDIKNLESAYRKEKEARKEAESKVRAFGGKSPDEIHSIMDEYEAMKAGGKFDIKNLPEAEREALVKDIVDIKLRKFEREKADLAAKLSETEKARDELKGKYLSRDLESFVRQHVTGKVIPDAVDDALFIAKSSLRHNEEDGKFYSEDGTEAGKYLDTIIEKKKHWQATSHGGGAKGGSGGGVNGREESFKEAQKTGDVKGMLKNAKTIE